MSPIAGFEPRQDLPRCNPYGHLPLRQNGSKIKKHLGASWCVVCISFISLRAPSSTVMAPWQMQCLVGLGLGGFPRIRNAVGSCVKEEELGLTIGRRPTLGPRHRLSIGLESGPWPTWEATSSLSSSPSNALNSSCQHQCQG